MSWSTPPTFSDGNVLSASQLNILSADLEHLYGLLQSAIQPFQALELNNQYANNLWYIRYKERYLHYKIRVTGANGINSIAMYVNSVSRWSDSTPRAQGYTFQSYIDMNGYGFTAGNLYNVYLTLSLPTYSGGVTVDWLRLSGSTTL